MKKREERENIKMEENHAWFECFMFSFSNKTKHKNENRFD